MPLLEWSRDRDWEAGGGPIPHLGAFAHHGPKADLPRDERGVREEGDPVCHQFLPLAQLGVVPGIVALQVGLFPAGRVSAVIQEGVWEDTLMSSCSICDMDAVLTPPSTSAPGTAPVPSQPVMSLCSLSPQGRNLGVLLLGPLGWREQVVAVCLLYNSGHPTAGGGKLNSGSLKLVSLQPPDVQ